MKGGNISLAQYSRKLKKGIRWWYKFDYNGRTYSSKCTYLSKNEAKKAENTKYGEISKRRTNYVDKPILSLLEAINERLDYIQTKKSKHYYKQNKQYCSLLYAEFGNIAIDHITKPDMNSFLLDMSQRLQINGKDNYAVNAALRIYKALFQMIIRNYDLDMSNPCIGIEVFSVKRKLKYIPSDDDIDDVKVLCDEEQKLLIDFVLETGARINEALQVTGKDIGIGFIILYTRKSKYSDLVPRKVPISSLLPVVESDERLFKRWSNNPKFLEKKIRKLKQKEWNWHNLRHRYASSLSKQGKPLFEIMTLLGHSQLSTTQNYLQMLT